MIPVADFEKFVEKSSFSESSVRSFAKQQGIAPGIVVGRLQNEGFIKHSMMNNLKEHYEIAI